MFCPQSFLARKREEVGAFYTEEKWTGWNWGMRSFGKSYRDKAKQMCMLHSGNHTLSHNTSGMWKGGVARAKCVGSDKEDWANFPWQRIWNGEPNRFTIWWNKFWIFLLLCVLFVHFNLRLCVTFLLGKQSNWHKFQWLSCGLAASACFLTHALQRVCQ